MTKLMMPEIPPIETVFSLQLSLLGELLYNFPVEPLVCQIKVQKFIRLHYNQNFPFFLFSCMRKPTNFLFTLVGPRIKYLYIYPF